MQYFEALGSLTGDLWKKYNNDERRFPEMAHAALLKMPPQENITFDEVVEYAMMAERLPHQEDLQAEFGQPPLTIYQGRDFRIEVLFWTGATPAIHQHAFSGAFHVMHGSSIHLAWHFNPEERVSSHLHYGHIGLERAELLKLGDTRLIHAGNRFIHTTFHLDTPTVSIVVRTTNEQDQLPQYAYLPPTICYNARENMPSLRRKTQILAMLVNANRPEQYDSMLSRLFAVSDAFSAFHYLYQANMLRDKAAFQQLLNTAAVHHPGLVARVAPALAYIRRQTEIVKLRSKVTDSHLKFFLALLINVADRESILSLLKDRYPDEDPAVTFTRFVKQLSDADLLTEKFTDPWLWMVECLLRGLTTRSEVEQAFSHKYGEDQIQNQHTKLANLAITVSRFWLLSPLLEHEAAEPLVQSVSLAGAVTESKEMSA